MLPVPEPVLPKSVPRAMLDQLSVAFERAGLRLADLDKTPGIDQSHNATRIAGRISRLIRRFEETLDHIEVGIMMIDAQERVQLCNRSAREMLDLPPALMLPRPPFVDVLRYQRAVGDFRPQDEALLPSGETALLKNSLPLYRRIRPNGTVLEIRTIPLGNGGYVRTFADITAQAAHENALAAKEAEYRGLFENAVIGIYRSSKDGRQLRANPALVRLNGYDSEKEMLQSVNDIGSEWYVDPTRRDEFKRQIAEHGRITDFVSEIYRHKSRDRIWISESAWLMRDAEGNEWYEGTVADASERVRAEQRIAYLAMHDQATGLANRISLMERATAELASKGKTRVAAFLIDLDGFKSVNDTFGHAAGDDLLVRVAQVLRRSAKRGDIVARYGGDEFVILRMGDQETIAELGVFAAGLVQALSRPYFIASKPVRIGASVGVSVGNAGEITAGDLLKSADVALYRAKADGKQTYRFYDPDLMAMEQTKLQTEADLRMAIATGAFELHYQPIVSLADRSVASYEALIRWIHPHRGVIPPSDFIPVAESAGLMGALGNWILETACQEAHRLPDGVPVSVNVSTVQLRDRSFIDDLSAILKKHKLPANRLIVEITESVFMNDERHILDTLNQFRAMGIAIALDDFGTGYSALSYLQKFNFDRIKLDRSFVRDVRRHSTNGAIIRAILALGRDLGIPVVAEGIERETQLPLLMEYACGYAQGYLFGRPLPLKMLAATQPTATKSSSESPQ